LILKLADGSSMEVHLALTKFVTQYELVFHKGNVLEVTGVKVKFEGVDTVFARKIKRADQMSFCSAIMMASRFGSCGSGAASGPHPLSSCRVQEWAGVPPS
jgi:hypothetical protein